MSSIIIDNVTFAFTQHDAPFFDRLSVTFEPNNMHIIQGRNGTGKSTLFSILKTDTDHQQQVGGTLRVDQKSYDLSTPGTTTGVVRLVNQDIDSMLADNFTVGDHLAFAHFGTYPNMHLVIPAKELPPLLRSFNIELSTPVGKLSGGQRQLLAICLMLQKPTRILLLDEPTAALDDTNAHMVMKFINHLTRALNITALVVTHDKELITQYAPHHHYQLVVMDDGTRTLQRVNTTRQT